MAICLKKLSTGFSGRRFALIGYLSRIFGRIIDLPPKLNKECFRPYDLPFERELWMILLFVVNTVDGKSFLFLKDYIVLGKSQRTGRLSPKRRGFVLHFL